MSVIFQRHTWKILECIPRVVLVGGKVVHPRRVLWVPWFWKSQRYQVQIKICSCCLSVILKQGGGDTATTIWAEGPPPALYYPANR